MAVNKEKALISRVVEIGGRSATYLENGTVRVLVDDVGGMVPQFSSVQEKRQINAHWLPWFRANSERPFDDKEHGAFWKSNLLFNVAGNFPCVPNFGPGHIIDGVIMPHHGWTANLKWEYQKSGADEESGAVWAAFLMKNPDKKIPLSFKKIDLLIPGHPVHYESLTVKNSGDEPVEICAGYHNTLGAPFLQAGCKISAAADIWTTPPQGWDYDATTRLALGAEFVALSKAPLTYGGKTDLSDVQGPIGCTDFVVGAIPHSTGLGWSSLVNPKLKLAYVCFFPGPAAACDTDIVLHFNNLLLQYGGRRFTPWAPWEGGPDMSYCVGTPNTTAAYSNGLDFSRKAKKVLDSPATISIPARGEKTLFYGSLFAPYENNILDGGIVGIDADANKIVCKSATESWKFNADSSFTLLRRISG